MKNGLITYIQKIRMFEREAKLFLITVVLTQLLNGGYQVVFNLYLNSLGYQSDYIGAIESIRLISGALLGIPLGIIANRIGYRKTLIVITSIIFVSIFGIANFNSPNIVFGFSILWGIAFVLRGILTAPFLARYSREEERSHLFGLTFSLQMWSSMLGSFLGGSLPSGLQNFVKVETAYRYTLNIYAVIAILVLIPVLLLRPEEGKRQIRRGLHKNVVNISKYRDVRLFMLYSILIGSGAGLVVPLFNIFLRLRLNASDFQIGTLISLTQIATSVGCLLTPYLIKLFGQNKSVVVSQLLSVPFLIIVGGVQYFPVVAISYFLRSSLMNMVNPVVESVSMQLVSEEERSAASSLIRTFRSFGRGTGVFLSGILLAKGSYLLPFVLTCILYFSGSLVFYYGFRSHPKLMIKEDAAAAK